MNIQRQSKAEAAKVALREWLARPENQNRPFQRGEVDHVTAATTKEGTRRLRELRDEEGYEILRKPQRPDLGGSDYLFTGRIAPRGTSVDRHHLFAEVSDRARGLCENCGAEVGRAHQQFPDVRVTISAVPRSHGGASAGGRDDTADDFAALCQVCASGRGSAVVLPKEVREIATDVRRLGQRRQHDLLAWLQAELNEDGA